MTKPGSIRRKPNRVLIADDNARLLELLSEHLTASGFEVTPAEDGHSALRALESAEFDVVLSDIRMPGVDGLELLQRVRAERPETEFVIMTAYATLQSAMAAVNLGAHSYLQKPFALEEVRLAVERAVERRQLRFEREALVRELEAHLERLKRSQGLALEEERSSTYTATVVGLSHLINNHAMAITLAVGCARRALRRSDLDAVLQDLEEIEAQALEIADRLERARSQQAIRKTPYVGDTFMIDLADSNSEQADAVQTAESAGSDAEAEMAPPRAEDRRESPAPPPPADPPPPRS